MWKVWNKLFGWQYAIVRWGFANTDVVRVLQTQRGEIYYKLFGEYRRLTDDHLVMWLTEGC